MVTTGAPHGGVGTCHRRMLRQLLLLVLLQAAAHGARPAAHLAVVGRGGQGLRLADQLTGEAADGGTRGGPPMAVRVVAVMGGMLQLVGQVLGQGLSWQLMVL